MRGLPRCRTPMLPIREGMNVQRVSGVLGLPLGAFCAFTAPPCGLGEGQVCVHMPSTGGDLPKGPSGQ